MGVTSEPQSSNLPSNHESPKSSSCPSSWIRSDLISKLSTSYANVTAPKATFSTMAPLSLISEDNNLLDNTIKYSVENIRTEKEDAIKMAY